MQKIRIFVLITALIVFSFVSVDAQELTVVPTGETITAVPTVDPNITGDESLCLPDAYLNPPDNCSPLGPSEYLTDLAGKGLTYPALPFSGKLLDESWVEVNAQYAKINVEATTPIALYSTATDAAASINPIDYIGSGELRYVSYSDMAVINDGTYVKNKTGSWLRASIGGINTSMLGRTFSSTPEENFGWVIESGSPFVEPYYNAQQSSKIYYREEVLTFFDYVEGEDTIWYQVGENEWFPRRYFHPAWVNTTPPAEIQSDRWIEVNLYDQVVTIYEDYSLVYACLVATGMEPFYTQPGIFQIYEKKELEDMNGAFEVDQSDFYYFEDVPWTMYFDQGRAIHGAYWRAWYGYTQSHGCVNMSIGDAHWVYDWSVIGDYVYVHDPSGETPTDPAFYGAGGA